MTISANKLVGASVPGLWAQLIGATVATKAGAGTTQGAGTALVDNTNLLTTSGGATAFVISDIWAIGDSVTVYNTSATAALVYPPSGGAIDGGSTDASVSVAQNEGRTFQRVTSTSYRSGEGVIVASSISISGNATIGGALDVTGASTFGSTATITSASASALAVGLAGATNPSFVVDSSTGSQAAGLKVTGAIAAGSVAVAVISSGADANLTVNAKGSGTVTINGTATGNIVMGRALTGVSSSMTGGYVSKSGTAVPASAGALAAGAPISMFSDAIKIWVTSDTPAFSATKGDLAINTGGSSSSTRLFVNNGTTNWVAITTAS